MDAKKIKAERQAAKVQAFHERTAANGMGPKDFARMPHRAWTMELQKDDEGYFLDIHQERCFQTTIEDKEGAIRELFEMAKRYVLDKELGR